MKWIKLIAIFTALFVVALATGSLILSFQSIRGLAGINGYSNPADWIFAAIADGFIIISSVEILRATLQKEGRGYAWTLVGAATLGSVVLNVIHAPSNTLARVLHGIPPVALALSFHLLIKQIENGVKRVDKQQSLDEMDRQLETKAQELNDIASQAYANLAEVEDKITRRGDKLKEIEGEITTLRASKKEIERQAEVSRAEVRDTVARLQEIERGAYDTIQWRNDTARKLHDKGISLDDIAEAMGVSVRTIQRAITTGNENPQPGPVMVAISQNGKAHENLQQ